MQFQPGNFIWPRRARRGSTTAALEGWLLARHTYATQSLKGENIRTIIVRHPRPQDNGLVIVACHTLASPSVTGYGGVVCRHPQASGLSPQLRP